MTATAHALIAGAIASSIQNPAMGIALSAISHPICDLVPHWDVANKWRQKSKAKLFLEASADLAIGVGLAYFIFGQNINFWYFVAAMVAVEFWDVLEAPYWFFKWKFFPFGTIYSIQSRMQNKLSLPWGMVYQTLAVLAVIFVLKVI